ncbi:MAG: hypothetical protein B193_1225 [Solidesulfovibrio magneticus str. Maddingley MBC34]|uniref:Uncharacterized protein n=1 Tax=Solidesulfovibrio magneticus str. Maddingley MBC34 TaxID=1206767 RepID=K6HC91_9BACT|nr:MAG: hypothetical protein B193_1225 [Solidesulfovibrio magneticus str. Maddingley MBC34]
MARSSWAWPLRLGSGRQGRCLLLWALLALGLAGSAWFFLPRLCLQPQGGKAAPINLFAEDSAPFHSIHIQPRELSERTTIRWLLGPVAGLRFYAAREQSRQLRFKLYSPFPSQVIVVHLNGAALAQFDVTRPGPWLQGAMERDVAIQVRKGINEIVFSFSRHNGQPETLLDDGRPLAAVLLALDIS